MLYLLVVVITAVRWRYGTAVLCSALSVLVFNFFFVPPEYTLHVEGAQYLLTFAGLFVVGVVIAGLTNRVREQAVAAQLREAQTAELYALSRDLVATIDLDKIIAAVQKHINDTFHVEVAILIFEDNHLQLRSKTDKFVLKESEHKVACWVYDHLEPAGCGTNHWSGASVLCIPLQTIQEKIGVLVLQLDSQLANRADYRRLIDAFANQAALAIEAGRLAAEAQQAQLLREREALQSAVLNSISHDLRTPLVSIAGALSTLRDKSIEYQVETKRELVDGAWQETQRLNRIVANLLDMSRLRAGTLQLKYDWYDVQELIAVARSQLADRLTERPLKIDIDRSLPLVQFDLTFMAHVLTNLLDNALKYSNANTPIEIRAFADDAFLTIEVADRGVGIPEEDLPHIYETFYRARRTRGIGGTGLGLSICKGIVTAHQGTIEATNRQGGGAVFRIQLPIRALWEKGEQEIMAHEA
jgi:two-component system sensor histidine kinase KdpD